MPEIYFAAKIFNPQIVYIVIMFLRDLSGLMV